jgi:hypothetical protein
MMMQVGRRRGGNFHPLPVRDFIVSHLSAVGEDTIKNMHQAYLAALEDLARTRGRKTPYRKATWHSFYSKLWQLAKDGLVIPSGREVESDEPEFADWDQKPMRKYWRLA